MCKQFFSEKNFFRRHSSSIFNSKYFGHVFLKFIIIKILEGFKG
jgi:hypothetical protein